MLSGVATLGPTGAQALRTISLCGPTISISTYHVNYLLSISNKIYNIPKVEHL